MTENDAEGQQLWKACPDAHGLELGTGAAQQKETLLCFPRHVACPSVYFKEQQAEIGKGENTGKLGDKLEAQQGESGKRA